MPFFDEENRAQNYCGKACRFIWQLAVVLSQGREVPVGRDRIADAEWVNERMPVGNTSPISLSPADFDVLVTLREIYVGNGGRRVAPGST